MADAPQRLTLRWSRLEKKRLWLPLVLSLFFHILAIAGYRWAVKHHWLQPAKAVITAQKIPPAQKPPPPKREEEEAIFIEVGSDEKEPPKKSKFYSSKNSIAANPDTSKDTAQPKIEGTQTDYAKTQTAKRPTKLAFATPAPAALHGITPDKSPAPTERGDLDQAQKNENQKTQQQPQQQQRPRTLREAMQNLSPGEAMKQDGGVRRHSLASSLDATRTAFGDYDAKLIDAVQTRWFAFIEKNNFANDRPGKVVIFFKLKYDGSILEMRTDENTVGITLGYFCREAIQQAAPFARWPDDMRRMIGQSYREVKFTFYY